MRYIIIIICIFAFVFCYTKKEVEGNVSQNYSFVEYETQSNHKENLNCELNMLLSSNKELFTQISFFMLQKEGNVSINNSLVVNYNNNICSTTDIFNENEIELIEKAFTQMGKISKYKSLNISKKTKTNSTIAEIDHIVFMIRYVSDFGYEDFGLIYCESDSLTPNGCTKIEENWWSFRFGLV